MEPHEDEDFFLWDIPETWVSMPERQEQSADPSIQVEESPVLFPDGVLVFSSAMLHRRMVQIVGSQNLFERMKNL